MCPDETNLQQCPCCDYFTFPVRADWDICPVCFWEDDGSDVANPGVPSGCNHGLTLREGRQNFLALGACEASMLQHVCPADARTQYRHEPRAVG